MDESIQFSAEPYFLTARGIMDRTEMEERLRAGEDLTLRTAEQMDEKYLQKKLAQAAFDEASKDLQLSKRLGVPAGIVRAAGDVVTPEALNRGEKVQRVESADAAKKKGLVPMDVNKFMRAVGINRRDRRARMAQLRAEKKPK